jgi:Tfp pilus assembly protein FimT
MRATSNQMMRQRPKLKSHADATGFTVLELTIVMLVLLIVSGIAIPGFLNMQHTYRLNGALADFAGLLQVERLRAVDDDRYYSTYILAPGGSSPLQAFVDIYPQNVNGSSGTGGQTYTCSGNNCDPVATISAEVTQQPAGVAPNTGNLQSLFLPSNSPIAPKDGMNAATPITFGPAGLPCTPVAVTGGTVCDTSGGPTAYWTFFQNSNTQNWGAVTVTPAGRIQRWLYSGGTTGTWANY